MKADALPRVPLPFRRLGADLSLSRTFRLGASRAHGGHIVKAFEIVNDINEIEHAGAVGC